MFDDKAVNDYIEEGLKAIDEETKTDEDIREISRLIKDELVRNATKGICTKITDLNGNWLLVFLVASFGRLQFDLQVVVVEVE